MNFGKMLELANKLAENEDGLHMAHQMMPFKMRKQIVDSDAAKSLEMAGSLFKRGDYGNGGLAGILVYVALLAAEQKAKEAKQAFLFGNTQA